MSAGCRFTIGVQEGSITLCCMQSHITIGDLTYYDYERETVIREQMRARLAQFSKAQVIEMILDIIDNSDE